MSKLLENIRLGVDYIEAHLHETVDLRKVSSAGNMSHSSFQRAFKSVTGETLKRYVRSRRLSNAIELLENTNQRILDIALAAGYESQESFARVFKDAVGITPTEYRQGQRVRTVLKKVRIDDAYLHHLDVGIGSTEPLIEYREAIGLVGLSTLYDGDAQQKNTLGEDMNSLWNRFLQRGASTVAGGLQEPYYGVIHEAYGADGGLEYIAAFESDIDSAPAGFATICVPAGWWAVFEHRGLPSLVDNTVNYIYGAWLVRSTLEHSGGADLEIYGPGWVRGSSDSVMHYAIPLLKPPETIK